MTVTPPSVGHQVEEEVVVRAADLLDGLRAGADDVGAQALAAQQFDDEPLHGQIVIEDQHARFAFQEREHEPASLSQR